MTEPASGRRDAEVIADDEGELDEQHGDDARAEQRQHAPDGRGVQADARDPVEAVAH